MSSLKERIKYIKIQLIETADINAIGLMHALANLDTLGYNHLLAEIRAVAEEQNPGKNLSDSDCISFFRTLMLDGEKIHFPSNEAYLKNIKLDTLNEIHLPPPLKTHLKTKNLIQSTNPNTHDDHDTTSSSEQNTYITGDGTPQEHVL